MSNELPKRDSQTVDTITSEETLIQIRNRYRNFAEFEAKGVSPLYEELAWGVAESETLLHFIASLPQPKQQPNLVFAVVRHLCGTPRDYAHFQQLIEAQSEAIRNLILQRSTQTNEPGRCATLLPVLGQLPQPLALIEVGASAGLCLLFDHYRYDYGKTQLGPDISESPDAPVFPCEANDETPIPGQIPQIVFRAGLDLNPIDVSLPQETAWLETLVWPGQEHRARRLEAAIKIAQQYPVRLMKGDLLTDLPALAVTAPKDTTLVIFHSAVLAYVSEKDREKFATMVMDLGATWISNEGASVFPQIAAKLGKPVPSDRFLLSVNGEPVAITGPHGQSVEWFSRPTSVA